MLRLPTSPQAGRVCFTDNHSVADRGRQGIVPGWKQGRNRRVFGSRAGAGLPGCLTGRLTVPRSARSPCHSLWVVSGGLPSAAVEAAC